MSILPEIIMARASNQFILVKLGDKSPVQEHINTFFTAHMLEVTGSKAFEAS